MGYSRRKRRGRAATNKKILRSKSNSAQQMQILDLNKKINTVNKKLEGIRYKVVHRIRLSMQIIGTTNIPYRVLSLNAPSLMTQIFSAPNESQGGKYNYDRKGRTHLTFNIVSNNEPSPLPLQVFILSAKNSKVALEIGLNVTPLVLTLTADIDYVNNISAATYINKKRYNIHKHWMINLSPIQALSQGVPAQWQGDLHPIRRKFSMRNPLVLNNRTGIWDQTPDNGVNPNQRLFMVVFNNNTSQTTSFPILSGLVVHSAYTSE